MLAGLSSSQDWGLYIWSGSRNNQLLEVAAARGRCLEIRFGSQRWGSLATRWGNLPTYLIAISILIADFHVVKGVGGKRCQDEWSYDTAKSSKGSKEL